MEKKIRIKAWMLPWMFLLFIGCATIDDVQILDKDIHRIDSQLNTLQKTNDSLRGEFTALQASQKDVQRDVVGGKTDSQTEIKKLRADLQNRMDSLHSELQILSTGIEEYKQLMNRPSKDLDRVKEDVAMRLRMVEERVKTYEAREKAREDRAKALEEGARGTEGRIDARIKGVEESLRSLEGKIERVVSRQGEIEKAAPPRETREAKEGVEGKGLSAGHRIFTRIPTRPSRGEIWTEQEGSSKLF